MGATAIAALVGAAITAVLGWATQTYRERRDRRLGAELELRKDREKAHELAADLYRDHLGSERGLPIRVRDGEKYDRLESD